MRYLFSASLLAALVLTGCASRKAIGKPVCWVDSQGRTNITQYRAIAHGGFLSARQSLIIAEVIQGQPPAVIGSASSAPVAQSVLGPVAIAGGFVWGMSARRPDRGSGGNTTVEGSSVSVNNDIDIQDDPPGPILGGKPPWGNGRGNGPKGN